VVPQAGCSTSPQQPRHACCECKAGSPRRVSLASSHLALLLRSPSHAQLQLSLPQAGWIPSPPKSAERFPVTSVTRAPYPQANMGERNLGKAMTSLSVCIGCLLSHTEQRWPPFPLFRFSVFNTAPGVISHLPGS